MTKQYTFPSEKFKIHFEKFLEAAQTKVDGFYKGSYVLEYTIASKYIRITSKDKKSEHGGYAYCFVCLEHGKVWKPKGYETPLRSNPRSCIFDSDFGASGVDWHGTIYLKWGEGKSL